MESLDDSSERRALQERVMLLERQLIERDEKIQELTSHLDKYRSIMPLAAARQASCSSVAAALVSQGQQAAGIVTSQLMTKQRTQGVSAEPQHITARHVEDTLRTYNKPQRYSRSNLLHSPVLPQT